MTRMLLLLIVQAFAYLWLGEAAAQPYPNKPIRIVVGTPPGGSTDLAARTIATQLQKALGQPVIVENRPGANSIVAHQYVSRTAPDGYTLITSASGDVTNVAMKINTGYNFMTDFIGIHRLTQAPYLIIASPSVPVKTLPELLAYAKKEGGLIYASTGVGTPSHLGTERIFLAHGVKGKMIPFTGAVQAMTGIMSNSVQAAFIIVSVSLEQSKAGTVRALAQTGITRSLIAPDIPTVDETVMRGFNAVSWVGLNALAGTPPEIVKLLSDKVAEILKMPEVKAEFAKFGIEPFPAGPEEYTAFMRAELENSTKVIEAIGLKVGDPPQAK